MNISLILAHPDPASLNHAIARVAREALLAAGHSVCFHDLYAEGFDPLLQAQEIRRGAALPALVNTHCAEIAAADGILVVHPNWWGMPPAILAGWIDRVLRPGVAYEFIGDDSGEGVPRGLLRARKAVIYNTSNTASGREERVFGDPLDRMWRDCVFGLCGVRHVHRQVFRIVVTSTPQERAAWLEEVRLAMNEFFPGQKQAVGRSSGFKHMP